MRLRLALLWWRGREDWGTFAIRRSSRRRRWRRLGRSRWLRPRGRAGALAAPRLANTAGRRRGGSNLLRRRVRVGRLVRAARARRRVLRHGARGLACLGRRRGGSRHLLDGRNGRVGRAWRWLLCSLATERSRGG